MASVYNQGIHVDREEVERLKEIARKAERAGQSLILLPPHRSHIDYVTLQWIFFRLGLSLPLVAAGDNLRIPLLGEFLQGAGAFYIRRTWTGDALYATVVQSYIDILLSKGYNFECFIEGTRSRTGKLLVPKVGMLRLICNTILREKASDCWILPVSVQYDRVIETESYVDELLGKPKEKETLWQLVFGGGGKLSLKLGRIDVHFAQPWSLKQFLTKQYTAKEYDRMLHSLGYRILNDINAVTVIMPGALVGTVILTLRGRGVGRRELVRRVEWLRDRIIGKGGRVAEFGNRTTGEVVDRYDIHLSRLIEGHSGY